MRQHFLPFTLAFLLIASFASAIEQPRIVPRSAHIAKPIEGVYRTLKHYFSDPTLGMFTLVKADEKTHTIVATRNGVDTQTWSNWAFCKAGPMEMIYKFSDGTANVTVHLEPSGRNATFATVTADLTGTYELASNQSKIPCVSKGALEQTILTVAGAAQGAAGS